MSRESVNYALGTAMFAHTPVIVKLMDALRDNRLKPHSIDLLCFPEMAFTGEVHPFSPTFQSSTNLIGLQDMYSTPRKLSLPTLKSRAPVPVLYSVKRWRKVLDVTFSEAILNDWGRKSLQIRRQVSHWKRVRLQETLWQEAWRFCLQMVLFKPLRMPWTSRIVQHPKCNVSK